ncbi:MAG: amylo-alpha-1,6-glucosidase, partial [Desulfosudaceae bacterium]
GLREEAASVLKQFGGLESEGTLPNMISGQDAGNRDTSDAPLWFFTACADMAGNGRRDSFLNESCRGRTIRDILVSIGQWYIRGTANGIKMDPASGLIFSPAHFTWMDTDHPAGTPRQGYCVEIQALWYAALQLLSSLDPGQRQKWQDLARTVRDSIRRLFPLPAGYLSDCLHAEADQPAAQAAPDDALRPNQLLALTLEAVNDPGLARSTVDSCRSLLVPGAIRSLADQPIARPLPVFHNGTLLNDPRRPYQGRYRGDEDTRRKPAYHNGTAWTWLFPVFCEAWAMVYGPPARATARAWMTSSLELMENGCLGHLPEIMDGDYPHTSRGCDAQAWGLSEWLRVWRYLQD